MTLPADEISDIKTPEANEASLSKPDGDTPNFELIADKDEKIAPKSYADISASEAPKTDATKSEKPEPVKAEATKSEPAKAEAAKSEPVLGGKALATANTSPVNPFLAAAAADKVETVVPPRSIGARLLDYSAHAAIIVGLIGFAWTVSDHVVNRPAKSDAAPIAAARRHTGPTGHNRAA